MTPMRVRHSALFILGALALASCVDADGGVTGPPVPDAGAHPDGGAAPCGSTGAAILFFEANCATCHQGSRYPDLSRTGLPQLAHLDSHLVPGMHLLVPGHPEQSFLFAKMAHTQGSTGGAGMPLGRADPVPELSMVEQWIRDGASTTCTELAPPTVPYDPNTLDPAQLFTCTDPTAPRSSPSRLRRITATEFTQVTVNAPGLDQNPLAPPSGLPYPTYSQGVGMDAATLRLLMMQLPVASEIWSAGDPVHTVSAGRMYGISSCCVDPRPSVVSCMETAPGVMPPAACVATYVDTLLRRGALFRAPTADESSRLGAYLTSRIQAEVADHITRHDTLSEITQAALLMTGSLFRSDVGDPTTMTGTRRRLSDTELAFELGSLLTDAPVGVPIPQSVDATDDPDSASFVDGRLGQIARAAADGSIRMADVRRSLFRHYASGIAADRPDLYVGYPDTRGDYWIAPRIASFFRAWLQYGNANTVFKDHPAATSRFADAGDQYSQSVVGFGSLQDPHVDSARHEANLVQQMDDLIARIVVESDTNRTDVFADLLTRRDVFLPAEPTSLDPVSSLWAYGFDTSVAPDDAHRWTTYPASNPRMGVLMHPAWLGAHGGNFEDDASLIHRGRWLRTELFCEHFGDLGNVQGLQAMLGASDPAISARHRVARATHPGTDPMADATTVQNCWGCHQYMNTLGQPFETFNHAGFERAMDHGGAVDGSTVIDNLPDPTLNGTYATPSDFVSALAHSSYARRGMVRHAFRYFMGRDEVLADGCTLVEMESALASTGSFFSMMEALIASDTFVWRDLATGGTP